MLNDLEKNLTQLRKPFLKLVRTFVSEPLTKGETRTEAKFNVTRGGGEEREREREREREKP